MLTSRFYYHLKPYLPWRLRMALRRAMAQRKWRECRDVWPINEAAGRPPDGWPGWPDGKQFALVLTHDVEGPSGLAKCRQLMQLEKELGFRSSFNFIPEGEYRVPRELREELVQNGFEVGVHDLYHDGKLYNSRAEFTRNAARINQYLKDWGAVGFRSGFMLHNLDWLHDLNILYDASTFDTDPFEPQPDGVRTIFPFWVPAPMGQKAEVQSPKSKVQSPNSAVRSPQWDSSFRLPQSGSSFGIQPLAFLADGYVELPYTLPQDSTLFLLFRERTTEIWCRKLDWIAQHRGMALLNVHPDYLFFPGQQAGPRTFATVLYAEFLEYVSHHYAKDFWQPPARDLAHFVAGVRPVLAKRRRVCMISHSYYESDVRVRGYAEALAERGDEVDVVALQRSRSLPREETMSGVKVFRLQKRERKSEESKLSYLLPLVRFSFVSSCWLAKRHRRSRYELVHVHNVPDFLVFAAWYPKLTGARIILDIHDIVPELFASKFSASSSSALVRALKWIERRSAGFAHHVILANHFWLEKYTTRSAPPCKCSVLINFVNTQIFYPRPRTQRDGRQSILFPGGLQWHQGLDIAIRALAKVCSILPQVEFHIYGDGNMKPELLALARELGLADKVRFFETVTLQEIAAVMAEADLGVVPKRADSFGNEACSTKILQFMALGVPVVVSNTKIDRYYFDDSVVRFFESGSPDALAEAILEVLQNDGLRQRLIANGLAYATRNSWESHKADYLELVDALIENRPPAWSESGRNPDDLTAPAARGNGLLTVK